MSRFVPWTGCAVLVSLSITLPAVPLYSQIAPPATPKRTVADTYFGTVIPDPYRWMEAPIPRNPEFRQWLQRQNDYTRQVLDRLPERAALRARLAELADIVTTVPQVRLAGSRWLYLKVKPGEQTAKLYAREMGSGQDRILLDPDTLSGANGSHWAIDYVVPEPNGAVVAYGTSLGDREDNAPSDGCVDGPSPPRLRLSCAVRPQRELGAGREVVLLQPAERGGRHQPESALSEQRRVPACRWLRN